VYYKRGHAIEGVEFLRLDQGFRRPQLAKVARSLPAGCFEQIAHLPEETQYKLLRGNAERLYRFTPAEPPALVGT